MLGIDQQLDGDIIDGLYASNLPSALNPFATLADLAGSGTTGNYGAFYDTTNQAFVAAVATPVTLNTTYLSEGMSIGNPSSRIVVDNYGVYNVQFSAQLFNSSGAVQTVTFWIRKNGVDIPNSAKVVPLEASAIEYTADWSWLVEANPTDYFEIIFLTPVITVTLKAIVAGGGVPAVPSMLVVITQGSRGAEGEIVESEYKFFGAAPQSIAAGGPNPSTLSLSTIIYPVKASVVNGRSRNVVYELVVSKDTASAGSITVECTIGGLVIPLVVSAGAGTYLNNNTKLTIKMNFRAGNTIEAIAYLNRTVPGGSPELTSIGSFGTWDKTISNSIIVNYIRTSGTTGWTVEVKQVTSELI